MAYKTKRMRRKSRKLRKKGRIARKIKRKVSRATRKMGRRKLRKLYILKCAQSAWRAASKRRRKRY